MGGWNPPYLHESEPASGDRSDLASRPNDVGAAGASAIAPRPSAVDAPSFVGPASLRSATVEPETKWTACAWHVIPEAFQVWSSDRFVLATHDPRPRHRAPRPEPDTGSVPSQLRRVAGVSRHRSPAFAPGESRDGPGKHSMEAGQGDAALPGIRPRAEVRATGRLQWLTGGAGAIIVSGHRPLRALYRFRL